jgi:hypothetical protein
VIDVLLNGKNEAKQYDIGRGEARIKKTGWPVVLSNLILRI